MALNQSASREGHGGRKKDWKLFDEKGLNVLVTIGGPQVVAAEVSIRRASGQQAWEGGEGCAIGVYPEGSLKRAREKHDEARRLLADDIDPGAQRNQAEHARRAARAMLEAVAHEWLKKQKWGASHAARNLRRLEQRVFPWLGLLAIAGIKRQQVRDVLAKIERTGHVETAYRILQLISLFPGLRTIAAA